MKFIRKTMRQFGMFSSLCAKTTISIASTFSTSPKPTCFSFLNFFPKPIFNRSSFCKHIAIVSGLVIIHPVKSEVSKIKSEMELASTIGFGLDSELSYIIQPRPSAGGGNNFKACVNGMPYGILVAITETCASFTPTVPFSRPCTTGMPLGILMGVTCP
jgi:hypothetical protein